MCLSCWYTSYFQWQLLISYDKFGASPNSTFFAVKPQVSTVMLVVKQIYAPKHLDLLSFNAFLVTTWQMPVMPFAAFERSWNCNLNLAALHLTPSGRLRNPRPRTSKDCGWLCFGDSFVAFHDKLQGNHGNSDHQMKIILLLYVAFFWTLLELLQI